MARNFHALALAGSLACVLATGTPVPAHAVWEQAPCDSVSAGGFVMGDDGGQVTYAVHGGCKNGEFWGKVNFVDPESGFHLVSTRITGYLFDPATAMARDLCGFGRINGQPEEVMFRVRVVDGAADAPDRFGITIDNWHSAGERFYRLPTRQAGGGAVQLHRNNRSNALDPGFFALQEWQMCGDMLHP